MEVGTHEDTNEEYWELHGIFGEFKDEKPAPFKLQYKRGKKSDVLEYVMLDEEERRKLMN